MQNPNKQCENIFVSDKLMIENYKKKEIEEKWLRSLERAKEIDVVTEMSSQILPMGESR
jgi:hypothetical protein